MQISLFPMEEFVEINELKEVTSPTLFQRGNVPHPEGLVSNDIFGITVSSRKNTFAYINLQGYFFHPLVYKAIRRIFRNIDKIVSGTEYYSINIEGKLVPDENGETGIEFIYNNWEKIKWEYSDKVNGMRNERIDMITKYKKNIIFMKYLIVIPPFYRDIKTGNKTAETGDINRYYASAIRLSNIIKDRSVFGFQFHATNYEIQNILVNIYDYFKGKLEKKNGIIRKYLMGKNVDYCTRSVITSPTYHGERRSDLMIDFKHAGIPISQLCALAYPFVIRWLKNFFERELFDNKHSKILYDPASNKVKEILHLKNPESIFNEKYCSKMINTFIKDPGSRFNKIEVPVEGTNKKYYLHFNGKILNGNKAELADIVYRPLTWTDLLYMACEDVTKDKHCMVTRYPLLDEYGIFISKIRVLSTTETQVVSLNGRVYKWYPVVNFTLDEHKIAAKFIDSVQFSNSYLKGIGGDYDGDQTTIKILFTQEANTECDRFLSSKQFYINANFKTNRVIDHEGIQTLYVLTKNPCDIKTQKTVSDDDKKEILQLKCDDITFSVLVNFVGNTATKDKSGKFIKNNAKYKTTDKIILKPGEYNNEDTIVTTIGRLLYNRIVLEASGIINITGYQNKEMTGGDNKKLESVISHALANDLITTDNMESYIDCRDWLLLQLNSVVCSSFTPNMIEAPKEVIELREELLRKYKTGIEKNDPTVSEKIEKELLKKARECLKDDIGMDLYNSGARGSFENNYKNMYVYRGAVKNEATGGYNIITNALSDGLNKQDFAPHSNTILGGAYPKSVGTEVSGYMAKELIAFLQTETLGDKGSDCGTTKTITVNLTPKNKTKYMDRYIQDGTKLVCLDSDTIERYVGKEVHMYSPLFCTADHLCNKCAGNAFYKLDKKFIGISCNRAATTCTNLNMKKFHENLVKTQKIDLSDMIF